MKFVLKYSLTAFFLAVVILNPLSAEDNTIPQELQITQEWYENNKKPILKSREMQEEVLRSKYRQNLERYRSRYLKEGNLDGVLSVDQEYAFIANEKFQKPVEFNYVSEIDNLHKIFVKELAKIKEDFDVAMDLHGKQYLQELISLEKGFTIQQRIEMAILIRKEINRFVKSNGRR
jgi:hypothetical protein